MSDPGTSIGDRDDVPLQVQPARTRLGRWWLDLPLRRKGAVLLLVPLAVAIGVLGVSYQLQNLAAESHEDVRVATTALVRSSRLTEQVGEAQSAVRGYAATGDTTLLTSFDSVAAAMPDLVADMNEVVPDDYREQVRALGDEAQRAVDSLAASRDRLVAGLDDDATAAAALDEPDTATDHFLAASAALRAELLSDIQVDLDEAHDEQNVSDQVLIGGLIAVIAASVIGGGFIATSIIGRTLRLSDNVERFSSGGPLLPARAANDEIGVLTRNLQAVGGVLVRSQRELTASRDAALAATRAKDEFLSRTSHELRTPLSAIIGFGQLLQMEDLSDDDRESVDHIVRAGQHLLSLINEVLDIARIERGVLAISPEPVAVAGVVDEAVALARGDAEARDIAVSATVPDGLVVEADPQRLRQVVLNLLTNAVKYNHDGGRIDIDTTVVAEGEPGPGDDRSERECVRVAVTDTGIGLTADQIDRLFEPFERLDAASRGIDGTGVGLALSKALIEAMDGRMGVESERGSGSTFWFDLPRAHAPERRDAPAGAPVPAAAVPAVDTGALVLSIEDNEANRELMARVLRDRPERLRAVSEGGRGLELARVLRPDVILLDLDLPDVHGREVLDRLRDDPATADIPVVVVSADATARSREELLRDGAVRYLTKPVDVHELGDTLDDLARAPGAAPRA